MGVRRGNVEQVFGTKSRRQKRLMRVSEGGVCEQQCFLLPNPFGKSFGSLLQLVNLQLISSSAHHKEAVD